MGDILEKRSDDELMALVQRDDRAAFRVLVERHEGGVFAHACKFFGDRARAHDVTQDVMFGLWRDRQRYQAQGRFKTYLMVSTLNRCNMVARGLRRYLERLNLFRRLDEQPSSSEPEAELRITQRSQLQALQKAIDKLAPTVRHIVLLRYLGQMSITEIAEVVSLPEGTIKSHLSRGLRQLQGRMLLEESR